MLRVVVPSVKPFLDIIVIAVVVVAAVAVVIVVAVVVGGVTLLLMLLSFLDIIVIAVVVVAASAVDFVAALCVVLLRRKFFWLLNPFLSQFSAFSILSTVVVVGVGVDFVVSAEGFARLVSIKK